MDLKGAISKIRKTAVDTASTVAQSAKEGSAVIAKKSEELVEISKLTVSISSTEAKIKDIYSEIGRQLCEKHEAGIYIDPDLVENCNEVIKLKTNVKNMKDTILQLKNKKRCPECEESFEAETAFCPKCGSSTENIVVEFSETDEAVKISGNSEETINDQETILKAEIIDEKK